MADRIKIILLVSIFAAFSSGIVGQAVSGQRPVTLVEPVHPAPARGLRGSVAVRIVTDKKGDVVAGQAVSGPTIFYAAAEQAARKSKFAPMAALRLTYAFDDHVQEQCEDRELKLLDTRSEAKQGESVWDMLTFSKGIQSIPYSATLRITFLETGEIGTVRVDKASEKGYDQRVIAVARRIPFVPECKNGNRTTVTRMVRFDDGGYGFRLVSR